MIMGTSATITIYDMDNQVLCVIYKHWDGSPATIMNNLPSDTRPCLRDYVSSFRIVSSYSRALEMINQKGPRPAVGMGCLAAIVVGWLKNNTPGDVRLIPVGECIYVNYEYEIVLHTRDQPILRLVEGKR